jgi:hypothetical protein
VLTMPPSAAAARGSCAAAAQTRARARGAVTLTRVRVERVTALRKCGRLAAAGGSGTGELNAKASSIRSTPLDASMSAVDMRPDAAVIREERKAYLARGVFEVVRPPQADPRPTQWRVRDDVGARYERDGRVRRAQ